MTEVHVDPTHTISKASPLTQTVESDTVKVVCRVRPFVPREMQLHAKLNEGKPQWEQQPLRSIIEFHGKECVFLDSSGEDWIEKERFHFDFCYWSIPENQQEMEDAPYASQEKIFNDVGKTLLKHSWHGYNCCLFAYGQTGSGKTYSMMGPEGSAEDPGFIPRLCKQMFLDLERLTVEAQKNSETCITMYRVEVCYLELYNEQAKDLLWSLSPLSAEAKAKINPENLKIRNNPAQGTFVENLTMVDVESWQRCIELINKGNSSRSVAATKMNERSSRSHSIFKIIVTQITQTVPKKQFEKPVQSTREACINLVDLAGSERVRKSGATGDRFIEAANINKSLLTLKRVIDTLVDNATQRKKNIPPYRDSNLTALLKDSLGGNSKTYMLVCVSPHNDNAEESLLALRYASRARQIVNFVRINEDAASRRLLELEEELDRMRNELNTANNPELVEQLKAQIGEYEYGIQTMQEEMTLQQERIQQFKEAKERENKARHAMAFFNLHKLAQARFKKDEAVEEQNRLARQLSQVNNEKRNLAQRHQEAEKERERLRSSIDAYKMSSNQLDQEIDYWRARNQTLELYKAELQRNIEEQERDIHRRKEEKYARLFRTKFESHKIRNEFSNKLQEQTLRHKAELDAIYTDSQRKYNALVRTCIEKEEELEAELRNLQEEQARLEQELRGLKTDRTEEVAALEREVTHLTKERTMKQDDHQRFLDHSIEEWNRKYNTMVREMQVEQEKLAEQWERREHDDVKAEEEKFNQSRERFQSAMEQEKRSWDALAQQTDEDWQYKYESLQREWEVRLQEKSQRNQMLKKELRSVEEKELKYSALLHRVAAVLETANQDGPEDYLRLVRLLRTFQEEYTLNQPSKYKLQQLLRGENLKFRCQKAPQIGVPEDGTGVGTSTMNPASVGKSTLTPIARKGSSRLRGHSPKRC